MPVRFFILMCVGVLAVAIVDHDGPILSVQEKEYVHVKPDVRVEKRIIREVVEVPKPVNKPDGYMTEEQCHHLAEGTDFRDLIWQYGWPAGDDGTDSYAGYANYPLREDHDRVCAIDVFRGEVSRVSL